MKRLTIKNSCISKNDLLELNWESINIIECYDKLVQLEDIEEWCERIGKGDPVYEKSSKKSKKIYCDYYSSCSVTYNFIKKRIEVNDYNYLGYFKIDEYGKKWAFTRKELENG